MTNIVQNEFERRFRVIRLEPRSFQFWINISDFVDYIRSTPSLKKIIEDDAINHRNNAGIINDAWQRDHQKHTTLDTCEHGHKVDKEGMRIANELHASEISKIESLSVYCHFLDLELIYDAIKEMESKHTLYTQEVKCECTEQSRKNWQKELAEGAVKFEKELTDIHRARYKNNNQLLYDGDRFFNSAVFVYQKMMNALSNDVVEEPKPTLDYTIPPSFDVNTGLLTVAGLAVKINRQKGQNYAHKMLTCIFQSPLDGHPFSFLYKELTGGEYLDKKTNWKVCYRACQSIQQRVIKDTNHQITDFLDYGSGVRAEVKINSKYLIK